jgi:small GTP-binding protein
MTNYEVIKIIVLGNSGIGKTAFIKQICNTPFYGEKTIGVEFDCKIITYNNCEYKLQFLDCTGDNRFRNIIRPYYKLTTFVIIIFNADNLSYKSDILYWMEELNFTKEAYKYNILLIGLYTHQIYLEDIEKYIESKYMRYIFLNKKDIVNNNLINNNLIQIIIEMYNCTFRTRIENNNKYTKSLKEKDNRVCYGYNRNCYGYCNIM